MRIMPYLRSNISFKTISVVEPIVPDQLCASILHYGDPFDILHSRTHCLVLVARCECGQLEATNKQSLPLLWQRLHSDGRWWTEHKE